MTWLTVMECLCHKWPRMCFVCCNHTPVLSLFMVYHTTQRSATCGASTAYSSGTLEFAPFFTCLSEVRAVHFVKSRVFICLIPCPIRLPRKNKVRFILTHICFVRGSHFIYVICIYLRILMCNTISISDDVRITIIWRASYVEQDLRTLPYHLSSSRLV